MTNRIAGISVVLAAVLLCAGAWGQGLSFMTPQSPQYTTTVEGTPIGAFGVPPGRRAVEPAPGTQLRGLAQMRGMTQMMPTYTPHFLVISLQRGNPETIAYALDADDVIYDEGIGGSGGYGGSGGGYGSDSGYGSSSGRSGSTSGRNGYSDQSSSSSQRGSSRSQSRSNTSSGYW